MKFSVGYQLPDEFDSTYNICESYNKSVSDVYFSWADEPSGRFPLCSGDGRTSSDIKKIQLFELKKIKSLGISETLLLNANCYGEKAVSLELKERILKLVDYLKKELDIESITTTSPFLAECVKAEFSSSVKIRASVNMRIGTVQAINQLSSYFDGFYLQKELNRDFGAIKKLSEHCRKNGKTLHLLTNSGCLAFCGFQTFHDNMIAHQSYNSADSNAVSQGFPAPCWKYLHGLERMDALSQILQSSFIRPEDIAFYEPYFSEIKLATRMHSRPRMVVSAYARGRFSGNLLDLCEPSYSSLFKGTILDNTLMPNDWFSHVSHCNRNCGECGFCRETAEKIAIKMET